MDNTDFEREINMLLSELEKDREKLQRRMVSAQEDVRIAEEKIAALKAALHTYRERYNIPEPSVTVDIGLRSELTGLSTKDMLVNVARRLGGTLSVSEVTKLLTGIGLFKDKKNAADNIHVTLRRNPDTFARIGRGIYKLSEQPPIERPA